MPVSDPITSAATPNAVEACGPLFLSAEDFDATGILAGVEPCASNYWWIPELHPGTPDRVGIDVALPELGVNEGPGQSAAPAHRHAARRTSRQSTAA